MSKPDTLDAIRHYPGEIYPWLAGHWSFFEQCCREGRLAHALLIGGAGGNGKKSLARALVSKLLCQSGRSEACGQCRSCKLLEGGAHPDYFEVTPEEDAKVIKVDQVRALIGRLNLTASISQRKLAYIHPADSMNASAANALLKSLEEPAGDAVLILVSDNPASLPVTIRSRCQSVTVNQPDSEVVREWLEQQTDAVDSAIAMALEAGGYSPLRALHYLNSPELESYKKVCEGLVTLLERPGAVSIVGSSLNELNSADLWRWLSLCTGDVIKSVMVGLPVTWLPETTNLPACTLLQLQKKADINRKISNTPVRGDLLLQDWLIRWAEQTV